MIHADKPIELRIKIDENLTLLQKLPTLEMDYMTFCGLFERVNLMIKKNVSISEKLSSNTESNNNIVQRYSKVNRKRISMSEQDEKEFLQQMKAIDAGSLIKTKKQLARDFGIAHTSVYYWTEKLRKKHGDY